jgi:hypothetical protein
VNPFKDMAVNLLVFHFKSKGVKMKWYIPITSAIFLILGLAACVPNVPIIQESVSAPQSATPDPYYPLSTRTGIEEIDRILDASGDVQELRSLIQFTSARCTRLEGLGGPPKCLPDEGEGTRVNVLPFLGPEGSFLRNDEIEKWQGFEVSGLFAIYEISSDAFSNDNYPAGQYAILFVGKDSRPAIYLHISNGKLVRVDYIFDNSLESLNAILQHEAARLILAPVER